MDIALNISGPGYKSNQPHKQKNVVGGGKRPRKSYGDGFSFEFTKNDKVKALVARRRVVPKQVLSAERSPKPPTLPQKVQPFTSQPPPRNYVMAPKYSDDDDSDNGKEDSGIDLALNITKTPISVEVKKKKMSRDERMSAKRNERRERATKVFSKTEIDDGIKKFSALPESGQGGAKKQRPVKKTNIFLNNPETKIIGQRFVKPMTEKIFTGASMNTIGLHPHCVKNLADILKITELTTVQQKTIPRALEGRDILVRSQTGSGKTLAYALPVVQKLQDIRPKLTRTSGIQAVVIVPTRELAIQTYEIFLKLLKPYTWIVPGFLTGGEKRKSEKARLRKGINILVGTPGRLLDHLLHTETFKLDKTEFLVLDEADRLLELGYERDVKKIVEGISDHRAGKFTAVGETAGLGGKNPFKAAEENPEQIEETKELTVTENLQTLLLSATLTSAVQKLAGLALKNPLFIDTSDAEAPIPVKSGDEFLTSVQEAVEDGKLVIPATVNLSYVIVPPKLRLVTLSGILATAKSKGVLKALVFMSTMEMVNYHHGLLMECLTQKILDDEDQKDESESDDDEQPLLKGVSIFRLHGSMPQQERSGVFNAFRNCKSGVLLATDVAGRGIDISEVSLVIQYSPPQNISEFVHRVGRTARAGRSGQAILFIGPSETEFIRKLEDKRIRISQGNIEEYFKALVDSDSQAHNTQEAASNLQHKFELLVEDDKEIRDNACKAFVSWVRFYSAFPKDLKEIFSIKNSHMGHYAKSFALRDPPNTFTRKHTTPKPSLPKNRLTYTERDPEKIKLDKTNRKRSFSSTTAPRTLTTMIQPTNKFNRQLKNSFTLSTSEFASGLPELKKKKKK